MMKRIHPNQYRVLAITPSTRGFGFVVMEGPETLVDWGVKSVKDDKNARSLAKVDELIAHYQPGVMVLHGDSTKHFQRSARITELRQQIVALCSKRNVIVELFSREQVGRFFFTDGQGTKHALAEILSKRFPEELGFRLPPRRRPWMSEDYRMDIFVAVSLGLTFHYSDRCLGRTRAALLPLGTGFLPHDPQIEGLSCGKDRRWA